jgi:hypothetical protein
MVRNLLVIEVPDAGNKGMVTILLRPIDCFFLSLENAENMVSVVFDHVILNVRSFRAAFGTSFYVIVRLGYCLRWQSYRSRALRKLKLF